MAFDPAFTGLLPYVGTLKTAPTKKVRARTKRPKVRKPRKARIRKPRKIRVIRPRKIRVRKLRVHKPRKARRVRSTMPRPGTVWHGWVQLPPED